ncbi:MAG: phosphoribosylanthranilate isomerase [Terriglobia bacterium]
MTRVKICCISNLSEAQMAIDHGASALGLVSEMPSGPGVIGEDLIVEIAAQTPPFVSSFLLTSKRDTESIIAQQRRTRVSTLQIVDHLEPDAHNKLRSALPGIRIVQVIHVTGEASLDEAASVAPHVDAVLLDSGNPSAAVKELGGTGRTHDWNISAQIRAALNVPVILAGGLTAGNVQEAICRVRPFAVDVCSGVRTDGKLDEHKLSNFFEQVANANMLLTSISRRSSQKWRAHEK